MKRIFILIISCFTFSAQADYWTQKANYVFSIFGMSGFSIGTTGYCGTGITVAGSMVNIFRAFNPVTNLWSTKATFFGLARFRGTGLAIDSLGYLGLGIGMNNDLQDWWQYSPGLNAWTQKADFTGGPTRDAVGFSIGSYGYVATGGLNYSNQLVRFDPVANSWTPQNNFAGTGRQLAVGFTIDGKGYLGTGYNGSALNDFWSYDPVSNSWSQKANLPSTPRWAAAGFSIGNKGYIGLGNDNVNVHKDFWEYNPVNNSWTQKTDIGGDARHYTVHFSVGNKGYVGTGFITPGIFYNDFWEYTPDSTTGINEISDTDFQLNIFPNPANDFIICNLMFDSNNKIEIKIMDVNGKAVFSKQLQQSFKNQQVKIDISNFSQGIYIAEVNDGKNKSVKRFIK